MYSDPSIFKNPKLYEINTRVWIKNFPGISSLDKIPDEYWKSLKQIDIEYVWLMGVWKNNESTIEKFCFEEGLVKEYSEALPDWKREDVIGSPFSIDDYEINPSLGNKNTLKNLKKTLNSHGLKLILDFVPNHFSTDSHLLADQPEVFLQGSEENICSDSRTYFKKDDKIFAHGKDPYFPAWTDTAQINYCSDSARKFMLDRLIKISKVCDGVRCDMAMLAVNSIFKETWSGAPSIKNLTGSCPEFWMNTINTVKENTPEFIFIAEAYWDMEWQMQQLGFDFTYDKRLLDRLKQNNVEGTKQHLWGGDDFQKRSVRFIENHDEQRAIQEFGRERSKAAAVIMSTLQGMKLYHDGQFEGNRIKLPVQLGRKPNEKEAEDIKAFYKKLLSITSHEIFKEGTWRLLDPLPAWEGGKSFKNIMAWHWSLNKERRVVVVNFSEKLSHCSLIFDTNGNNGEFNLNDELNGIEYLRSASEIKNIGLYVKLDPYQSHIFSF